MASHSVRIGAPRMNLFQVLSGLRFFGLGSKVTRKMFKHPDCYYVITSVQLSADCTQGNVQGRLYYRGVAKEMSKLSVSAKNADWVLIETPNYASFRGSEAEALQLAGGKE